MPASPHQDPEYLQNVAYKDASRLNARIAFWRRYGERPDESIETLFDLLGDAERQDLLEIGCGPGHIWEWAHANSRIPAGWNIHLTDISEGMVEEARQRLEATGRTFNFRQIDAVDIPYTDSSFDIVIASYMLYHVSDLGRALSEIHRVLRPGGRLIASTNGIDHIKELNQLQRKFALDPAQATDARPAHASFPIERGAETLSSYFDEVVVKPDADTVLVDDPAPVVDYLLSASVPVDAERLRSHVAGLIDSQGHFPVTRSTGILIATC